MDSPTPSSLVEMLDAPGIRGLTGSGCPPPRRTSWRCRCRPCSAAPTASWSSPSSASSTKLGCAPFRELPHGVPSHDTRGRVFARLDASGFAEGLRDWVLEALAPTDGQSVRGSHDRVQGARPNRLVVDQTAVDDHSNELTAIPEQLRMLCLKGCIMAMDLVPSGWGCQKAIARQIPKQGADRCHHPR